jgi:hypothetical protein
MEAVEVMARLQKIQDDIDTMFNAESMKNTLISEYATIGEACAHALTQIIVRNEYPDADMETIRLARTIINGYRNILITEKNKL